MYSVSIRSFQFIPCVFCVCVMMRALSWLEFRKLILEFENKYDFSPFCGSSNLMTGDDILLEVVLSIQKKIVQAEVRLISNYIKVITEHIKTVLWILKESKALEIILLSCDSIPMLQRNYLQQF